MANFYQRFATVRVSPRLLAAVLIAIALSRVAVTFRTFSATTDEATHVGSGLELLQYRRYKLHPQNPPLPRLVMAAAPYVGGMRVGENGNLWVKTYSVFYNERKYEQNLVLARIGNLLFLGLAATAVWLWARRELGEWEGILALLLFSAQPIVLGYSGLATHDAAGTAGLAIALLSFAAWLEKPDTARSLFLGLAYGFGISCKFSCIGFVPMACFGIFVWWLVENRDVRPALLRAVPLTILIVLLTSSLVVWAGYGFTMGKVSDLSSHLRAAPGLFGALARQDPSWRLPAPALLDGIGTLVEIDRQGMNSYLFGKWTTKGWMWYFPIALGLKTTLAFMALLVGGLASVWVVPRLRRVFAGCLLASGGMMMLAMQSRLDIGVRFVLPVYAPLTLAATASAAALFTQRHLWLRALAVALVVGHIGVSVAAHPDYFPYFNLLAGSDPSRLLADSNLDWGQDVLRLRNEVRRLGVNHLTVATPGLVDYRALHFPSFDLADSHTTAHGWVAVSDHIYLMERDRGGWSWLDGHPYRRVGRSIRLFHLP